MRVSTVVAGASIGTLVIVRAVVGFRHNKLVGGLVYALNTPTGMTISDSGDIDFDWGTVQTGFVILLAIPLITKMAYNFAGFDKSPKLFGKWHV